MKHLLYLCILLLASQTIFTEAFSKSTRPIKHTYRLIHNNDGSDLLGNIWFNRRPLTLADLDSCVDLVTKNTPVTTYMICTGSDFFYVPSKYGHIMGDDLNGTLSCGTDTLFHHYYDNAMYLQRNGTDLVKATLTRAKKNGKETFITYRVNDLHFNDTTMHCPIYYTDWWLKHPQYWVNDTAQGWHSAGALDFEHQEVRGHKLAIISEQLENYADYIDGYELDFMRFFVYCKPGHGESIAPDMTQWMREIRKKVDEISIHKHKKILLTARVAPTLEANMSRGLDVRQWLKEGLLDFITIGIHLRNDPQIPVGTFKKELGKDLRIPLYASNDVVTNKQVEPLSHGMYRGVCSYILSQGADGMYLFNFYFGEYNKYNGQYHLEEGGQVCQYRMPQLLHELGSLIALEGRNIIYSLSEGHEEYGIHPNSPLPLSILPNSTKSASIYVGDMISIQRPKEVILFYRQSKPGKFHITLNGTAAIQEKPEYTSLYDRNHGLIDTDQEIALIFPASAVCHGENIIRFTSEDTNNGIFIRRIELALKYGDVKTHGYF